jgi:NADP-dependent 3-hydroxy acid dehydrogenase YdfG
MPTVVITGAAGAIGSVTARTFREAGWDLGLIDYGDENQDLLEREFPDAVVAAADLTREADAREAMDAVASATGGIGAVLGVAGGFAMQEAEKATEDDYRHMMDINFRTLFQTARAAIPYLKENRPGLLLGVSAPAAEEGGAEAGLYAASKAAVSAYLKSLHAELEGDGVRTSRLVPMGVVDTEANRAAMPDADVETWVAPRELAEGMLHVATRSRRGHIAELRMSTAG